MPNILRRKMFKLGGEVSKSHGVGLTHGLNFNKGGQVKMPTPSIVMGPDGKPREAHNPGGIIAGLLANIGKAGLRQATSTLSPLYRSFMRRFAGQADNVGGPGVSDYIKYGYNRSIPQLTGQGAKGTPITPLSGIQQAKQVAKLMSAPGILGGGAATGYGLGQAALERAGVINPPEADDNIATQLLKGVGPLGLNVNYPNLLNLAGQGLFNAPGEEVRGLYDLISGRSVTEEEKKDKPEKTIKKESQNMKTMKTEAQEKMQEYYQLLGGGKDASMSDWSRVFVAASKAAQESGDDPLAMITAGADEANKIGAEDKDLAQQAAVMGLQDVQQRQLMKEDTLNKIMISGGVDSLVEAERVYEAAEQAGDMSAIVRLPMKGTEEDDTQTLPNTVYTDIAGISGKLFVAYDSDMNPKITNNYQEALNHAEA